MALDPTKLVFVGPASIILNLVGAPVYTKASLKPETLTLSVEQKKGNVVFEDGTEEDWSEGLKVVGEMTVSELNTTDIIAIETADNMTVAFANTGKTVTVPATIRVFVDVENGKTKIVFYKTLAIGVAWTSAFSVA